VGAAANPDGGRKGQAFSYDDRLEAQHVPLRLEEVEALILNGGKVLVKEPGRLVHFLHRVANTMKEQGRRVGKLQRDVDAIREQRTIAAHPVARAVQAISELDEQQKKVVLDEGYLLELAKLEKARGEAELMKAAVENETNRIRMAIGAVLEDTSVPAETKAYLRSVLERIGYRY
jgi:16S rRNA G527 N7-methylase RsmG